MKKFLEEDAVFCALQKLEDDLMELLLEVIHLRRDRADALLKAHFRKKR